MLKVHGLSGGRVAGLWLAVGIGVATVVAIAGCAGYNTWPPQEGVRGLSDPNARPNDQVMLASLQYVTDRYPPDTERYAINLPEGLNPRLYKWIVDRAGEGAEPLTVENQDLPIYHLKQIKVRGREAEVMLLRPVTEAGTGPEGEMAYQPITVSLRGGLDGWRIVHRREWIVGLEEPPPLNFWTGVDGTAIAATETDPAEAESPEPSPADEAQAEADPPDEAQETTAEVPDDDT